MTPEQIEKTVALFRELFKIVATVDDLEILREKGHAALDIIDLKLAELEHRLERLES